MEQTELERITKKLVDLNENLNQVLSEVDRLKNNRDVLERYRISLFEESKKEEVRDTKTYAESLLRDTWNMLDNLHMIGFSYGSVIGGIRYDNKGRRIERKTVKIDEYHALRKKVVKLGIIK